MRTVGLSGALGGEQELRQLVELLVGEAELRHHGVAELRRIPDVVREVLPRAALRAGVTEVGRAEIRAAGAEVGVAGRAARLRKDERARHRLLVVGETLPL